MDEAQMNQALADDAAQEKSNGPDDPSAATVIQGAFGQVAPVQEPATLEEALIGLDRSQAVNAKSMVVRFLEMAQVFGAMAMETGGREKVKLADGREGVKIGPPDAKRSMLLMELSEKAIELSTKLDGIADRAMARVSTTKE